MKKTQKRFLRNILMFISFIVIIFTFSYLCTAIKQHVNKEKFEDEKKLQRQVKQQQSSSSLLSPIILQTFDQFFISTKSWNNLNSEIPELRNYFTTLLLPPLSQSSDKVGYIPVELFNLNSDWGTEEDLLNLIKIIKENDMTVVADIVSQHREGNGKTWFKFENPSFLNEGDVNINENDYYKYIDKLLYYPWGNSDEDAPQGYYLDGLPPDFDENELDIGKKLRNCFKKNVNGDWSLYKDCRNKVPMYGVIKNSNPSWLQSVNLCNAEVLKDYFKYMKKMKAIGINGIRIDEADAISSPFISLFFNSDVSKTPILLKDLIARCNESKAPSVDKNVLYQLEEALFKSYSFEDFTNVPFDIKLFENFTYELKATAENEKGWRGQVDMLDNINSKLNLNDWGGSFDYPLKFILNDMFNTSDNSINGKVFVKNKMLIGNDKYKSITSTLVDNHDTIYFNTLFQGISGITKGIPGNEINFYKILPAYFIILMLPGIPMINKVHYDVYKNIGLHELLQLRNDLCIHPSSSFEILIANTNDIKWTVSNLNIGIKSKLKPVVKSKPTKNTTLIFEINDSIPTKETIWSMTIYNTKLVMKISYKQ